ncbi:MAG: HAMP domain-containing protein [Clostridium sp.]|nr:HAMP domain-containing protein [Clostridium sp.]
MKRKFGLRMKFTLLFMGLMLLIGMAVLSFLKRSYEQLSRKQHLDYAVTVAQIVEGELNQQKLMGYLKTGQEDQDYYALLGQMKAIQKRAQVYYLYVVFIETEERGCYFFDLKLVDGESVLAHPLGERNSLKRNYPGLTEILNSKNASSGFDQMMEEGEQLDSVYVPLMDGKGEIIAFVGVDYSESDLSAEIKQIMKETLGSLAAVMVISFCILLCVVQFSILRPVYQLGKQAEMVSEGHFGIEIKVRGHDELSEITRVFNRMSKSIADNLKEVQKLNDIYYKYVPAKILSLLGKSSIADIELGNEETSMLTVFSFQMADFDRLIRKKSMQEMIDSINRVLHACVPVITDREGMVESFQNAGVTALFDNTCKTALDSAVLVCQKLNHMVLQKQIDENQAGIGIAYGPVTLGIIGQKKRMAAITVSQYRDMACYLQTIAYQYQAHILITRTAADTIPDFFEAYHTRTLGFLYNAYTGYADRIYDVYDGDDREEMDMKNATKEVFEQGVEQFCIRNFKEARRKFIAVLKQFRRDKAAKKYLYLCDKYSMEQHGKDEDVYFIKME